MPSLNTTYVKVAPAKPQATLASIPGAKCYNTRWWKMARRTKLEEQPLCEMCLEQGIVKSATDVHHIEPFADKGALWQEFAFNYENLMALCEECHHKIHAQRS